MPLINARSETIQALPTFRNLLPGQRCAVPLSGFYEWQKSPPPGKQTLTPYLVVSDEQRNSQSAAGAMTEKGTEQAQPQHRVAYLAGVFRQRRGDDGESDPMFVILTAAASDSFRWLHARQPVFLTSDEALLSWLDLSVPVEQAMVTVGCGQQFQHKLHCTRMLKDLSAPAPPAKAMKQKGIASFFSKSQQPGHKDKSKLTMNRTAGAIAAGPAALKAVRTIDKNNNKPPKSVQDNTTKSGSTVSPAKKPLQTKGAGRVFPKTDSKPTKK